MNVFIDKIENNIAELHFENDQLLYIDTKNLPEGIKEGSFLNIKFTLNNTKSNEVENNIKELINELSDGSQGGDFEI